MTDRCTDSIIRLPEVRRRTGLSTATIYRKAAGGTFPAKVRMSTNCVGWYESEVSAWIADPVGWHLASAA